MRPSQLVNLVILTTLFYGVITLASVNFMDCLEEVRGSKWGLVGGTDERGRSVSNITLATGLTYEMCVRACGATSERAQWSTFSQQLGSWLLPWLALLSQLPYETNSRFENLMSMLLIVGSPALAGYTLAFTVLNDRGISQRLSRSNHPNSSATHTICGISTVFQRYPLHANNRNLLKSLAILPENHDGWDGIAHSIKYNPTWSISVIASMAWVAIAYLFTVINSFLDDFSTWVNRNGQGIGSLWLWLLPIVMGWIIVSPKCDTTQLLQVIDDANFELYILRDGTNIPSHITNTFIRMPDDIDDGLRRDEHYTIPIYNYARFLTWADSMEDVLHALPRSSEINRQTLCGFETSTSDVELENMNTKLRQNSLKDQGYLGRKPLDINVLMRLFAASIIGLVLQWGTTGGAIMIHWFTPTDGLGCRTASLLLYGMLPTLVWTMLVLSSMLSYHSMRFPVSQRHSGPAYLSRLSSILLRRLGKFIAVVNAIWITLSSVFQFTNVFDTCWCNSSALGLRSKAYIIIDYSDFDLTGTRTAWISGMALAAVTAFMYILFVKPFYSTAAYH